ncbi:kinase-like domain-containing protein, partial [Pisolithus tinctorius]
VTAIQVKAIKNTCIALLTSSQRTLYEVHIWSHLQHENIIPLLGITTNFNHTVSMVTEWMEGGNAHEYVQDEAVDPGPLVLPQLLDIARGLHYLHSLHIAHGDMKGPNVLISEARRALITDFGSSCLTNPPPSLQVDPSCGVSLRWLAPERLNTPTPTSTQEADVWAFGMTVLELFSRKNPFHEVRVEWGVVKRIVEGHLPDRPSDESTSFRLCDSWWKICLECWEYDPVQRPAMNDIMARVER